MRPSRRGTGRAFALALACVLAGCGGGAPPAVRVINPTPIVFSGDNLDISRPCTLLTAQDAADISGLPFYRTMAANLVEGGAVRCAQGVGGYGLHGVVELETVFPAAGVALNDMFERECRSPAQAPPAALPIVPMPEAFQNEGGPLGDEGARVAPAALTPATPIPAPLPVINGRHCATQSGAYTLLLSDRLVFLKVRRSAGEIDAPATRRLASLVSFRLTRN